jgi:hypothetical protein
MRSLESSASLKKHTPPTIRPRDIRWSRGDKIQPTIASLRAINPSEHSQFRQPTIEERTTIQSLHASVVAPRFIVSTLFERNQDTAVTIRKVYNKITDKKERLSGLTLIEALIMEFTHWRWIISLIPNAMLNFFAP